jgi:DNA-binding LacI/PurR family transcriptional regulator
MTTIRDVAREAGVSPSTASAALRDLNIVKPQTHDRVVNAARKLSYHTNVSARALRSGRSGMFTLIVPDLETDFYSKLANSLANELFAKHLHLVIQISQYNQEKELEQIRELKASMCDGLFISPMASTDKDMDMARENIPVVCFDDASNQEENRFDSVETPDQNGMLDIISHLVPCAGIVLHSLSRL